MTEFPDQVIEHIPRLRRYARALVRNPDEADDLLQNALLRALSRQHLWQPGSNLRAWLFTILRNEHINMIRSARRRSETVPLDEEASLGSAPANQENRFYLGEVERALDGLSNGIREVVLLVTLEGFSYEEVAEIAEIPLGTVRSRLHRGREQLRVSLSHGGEPQAVPAEAAAEPLVAGKGGERG